MENAQIALVIIVVVLAVVVIFLLSSSHSNSGAASTTIPTNVTGTATTSVLPILVTNGNISMMTEVIPMNTSAFGWTVSQGTLYYKGSPANTSELQAWRAYLANVCETYNASWDNAAVFDDNGTAVFGCYR